MEPGLDVGGAESERVASRSRRARGVGQEAMLDPTLPEKQRARRRLVGAIALVLAAVIILPMVLDATPKPATGDIAIDIPEQGQGGTPPVRTHAAIDSGADAVHQDVVAGAKAAADAGTDGTRHAAATASGTDKAGAVTSTSQSAAGSGQQRFAEVFNSASGATDNGTAKGRAGGHATAAGGAATTAADNDLATRVAALPPTPATPGARYVVQLGSFESTASAQEWVKKLKRIGVPAFVNTDKGSDGVMRVQLRAGPFADRTTAQAAVQKVRLAGLTQTADAGNGR